MRTPSEIAQIIEESISVPNSVFLKNIGLPGTTIANMKNGSMPSTDKMAKIADGLGVSMDYLIGRKSISIGMDFGTTNTVTEKAPHIEARSFSQDESIHIAIEPKTIEKWTNDIAQLNSENRSRLQDYLELLLKSQDQDDKAEK